MVFFERIEDVVSNINSIENALPKNVSTVRVCNGNDFINSFSTKKEWFKAQLCLFSNLQNPRSVLFTNNLCINTRIGVSELLSAKFRDLHIECEVQKFPERFNNTSVKLGLFKGTGEEIYNDLTSCKEANMHFSDLKVTGIVTEKDATIELPVTSFMLKLV